MNTKCTTGKYTTLAIALLCGVALAAPEDREAEKKLMETISGTALA